MLAAVSYSDWAVSPTPWTTTYFSLGCQQAKEYLVTMILKSEPVDAWITENWDNQNELLAERKKRETNICGTNSAQIRSTNSNGPNNVTKRTLYQQYGVPPITFVGERTVTEFGAEAERFFLTNRSAVPSGLLSPGGYLKLNLTATCRESPEARAVNLRTLATAKTIPLLFRVSYSKHC